MNAGGSNARASSNTATATSLRPRNRRLISGLDDEEDSLVALDSHGTSRTSLSPSPFSSRPISPVPAPRLSRLDHNTPGSLSNSTTGRGKSLRGRNESPGSLSSLWDNSWTTIQSLASDLLGSDVGAPNPRSTTNRRDANAKLRDLGGSRGHGPLNQWGPSTTPKAATVGDIGKGTKEEQLAALRAEKRRDLLTQHESSYADALGRFKRRLSDDRTSMSAPPAEPEPDALVYVHRVQKNDTLAGITIRYNCSASALRKANRMWPNDSVQLRERILLPVDACAVKGKLVDRPGTFDLLGSESEALSAGQAEEIHPAHVAADLGEGLSERHSRGHVRRPSSSVAASSVESEAAWQHDSWVLLPGSQTATEIVRVPRKAIGYFPPARRKSISYSDCDTSSMSLELSRAGTNGSSNGLLVSPYRSDAVVRPTRLRGTSNADNGYFPAYLTGPGGVGSMGKDVRVPGPGQDGLNKMFAKHLPDVAPPRTQQALLTPELPLYSDETPGGGSGATTPNAGKNMNLGNMGGAIESWMRRVASKTQDALQSNNKQRLARASLGAPAKGVGGIGDLIEMTNEFEIGFDRDDDEEEEDTGSGRQNSVIHVGPSSSGTSYFDDTTIRGRGARTASDAKGAKAE